MSVNSKMTAIADAIRSKTGEIDVLTLDGMADAINGLKIGVELPTLTNEGVASDLLSGKELIDSDGNIVAGTFTIDNELNTQGDLIAQIQSAVDSLPEVGEEEPILQSKTVVPTANSQTVTADSGYDGLSEVTVDAIPDVYVKPNSTKGAATYTPTTSNQTISAGTYCSGVQTIAGDANLIPDNIVSGKSIFGVAGTAIVGSGEGSGETNYQTCTVTFDNESLSNDCAILALVATVLEDGVCKTYAFHKRYDVAENELYLMTLSNVVCGTKIYLTSRIYYSSPYVEIDGSAIYESAFNLDAYNNMLLTFTAPLVANEICTIYYAYDV